VEPRSPTRGSRSGSLRGPSGRVPDAGKPAATRQTVRSREGSAAKAFIGSPWRKPSPTGISTSLNQFFTISAPVLAGFAVGLAGFVVTDRGAFVAPDLVLSLLLIAMGSLILSMQLGLWAQAFWAPPSAYAEWYPVARVNARAFSLARKVQHEEMAVWEWYRVRAGRAYRVGIVGFLGAVAVAVLPPSTPHIVPSLPLIEYLPASIGFGWLVLELIWIIKRPRVIVRHVLIPDGVPAAPVQEAPNFTPGLLK